jgi:threonine dehydrogenase-like Zn-dependent dehydrogenase
MATAISRSLAIVTGASTGIGYELATICAENGFDLVIAADEPKIHQAAQALRTLGAEVEAGRGGRFAIYAKLHHAAVDGGAGMVIMETSDDRTSARRDYRGHRMRDLRLRSCRNFGTVSIVGVYGGFLDKIPMGLVMNRGLTFRMAQTPVQHYLPKLLERIEKGEIDPSFVITHRATLEQDPDLYKTFRR